MDEYTDFSTWLYSVMKMKNSRHKAEIVTLCWAIWKARNDWLWNKKRSVVNGVVAAAKEYLTLWTETQGRFFTVHLQPQIEGDGAVLWVKPKRNSVKVSVDAATFNDQGAFGIGLIARDDNGYLLQARSKLFQGMVDAAVAEIMAIKEALSWLIQMRWQEVILESDCLGVVQAIRSKAQMPDAIPIWRAG